MKSAGKVAALCVSALWVSAALSTPARAQQLITNGGFEVGLTGWTRADQLGSDGTFFVQAGTTSPANGFTVPAPPEGVRAAMTDAGAGGSHLLYQDFLVPLGTAGGSIGFSLFINNGADNFFTPANLDWALTNRTGGLNLNQQVRVDILTTSADPFSVAGGDILQNLYQSRPGDPLVAGYNSFLLDISPLLQARQGQTLRLRFAEVDNVSFLNLGVDRVSLQANAIPEPSSLLLAGGGLLGMIGLRRRTRRAA